MKNKNNETDFGIHPKPSVEYLFKFLEKTYKEEDSNLELNHLLIRLILLRMGGSALSKEQVQTFLNFHKNHKFVIIALPQTNTDGK